MLTRKRSSPQILAPPTNLATQTDKGKKERSVFTWNWHSTAVNRRGPGGGLPSDSRPSTLHGHAHGVFMCMSWLCIKRTGRTKGGVWATTILRQKREYIFSFLLPLFLYVFFLYFFFLVSSISSSFPYDEKMCFAIILSKNTRRYINTLHSAVWQNY